MKTAREHLFGTVHLGCDVSGREPDDVSDRLRVEFFEVEEDDLAIERFQRVNQCQQSLERHAAIDGMKGIFRRWSIR